MDIVRRRRFLRFLAGSFPGPDQAMVTEPFADKHRLPFTLVADEGGKVRKLFGVPGALLGLLPGRVTYVIDKKGTIVGAFDGTFDENPHLGGVREAVAKLAT